MLELAFSKMVLIGVVALVVLGPERLPRVARTAGALLGRAQRYLNDVKAEVSREIELDTLRQVKTDFETAAYSAEKTIHDNLRHHESDWNANWSSTGLQENAASAGGTVFSSLESSWRSTVVTHKRRSWRMKKVVAPVWYKRVTMHRMYVQSGAARMARYRPKSARRPARFF